MTIFRLTQLFVKSLAAIVGAVTIGLPLADADRFATIRIEVEGRKIVGHPLTFDDETVVMLHRDGQITMVPIDNVEDFEKVSDHFTPYPTETIQKRLHDEFSRGFQISRSAHFVVVHPDGPREKWVPAFERLYGQFTHYFDVRGFRRSPAQFPLVAIVLPGKNSFHHYAVKNGMRNPHGIAGYYSLMNNRIITYDQGDSASSAEWDANHITLIHEALHQFAFNCGIHSRWAPPPKWATEGLAVMFEARGVHNSVRFPHARERNHAIYLPQLKQKIAQGHVRGQLEELVISDRLFSTQPDYAYALSWGLAFYLSETQPRAFYGYLQKTGQREAFSAYDSEARARDFARFFGADFAMLESRLAQFLKQR